MLETKRLYLDYAKESDIEEIMKLEDHKDNRDFVWKGTYEEHKKEIESKDFLLYVIKEKDTVETAGFALIHLDYKSERFELRRFVISRKGLGYGKEVINALFKLTFEELNMNRFWLDVYPDNHVGIKLYESAGMHRDGILRQNYKSERGYLDQVIYSMLKSEYYQMAETENNIVKEY